MNVIVARLVFLAFLAMSGGIVYNALYLQDLRGMAAISAPTPAPAPRVAFAPPEAAPRASASVEVNLPPVSTDLPPLAAGNGESQLLVRAIQRELAARGYDIGEADGTLSVKTRASISTYESREGLPVTGAASDDLLHHLLLGGGGVKTEAGGSVPTGGKADARDDAATVKAVQQILADLGYAPGAVDGAIGSATAEAISAFQRDRNIPETGSLTTEFLYEIKRVTGRDLAKTAAVRP